MTPDGSRAPTGGDGSPPATASGIEPDDLSAVLDSPAPTGTALADGFGGRRAAVAVVVRTGPTDTEVLVIQRATLDTDPWSGHMAFPGGRVDPGDRSSRHTAERETAEEVGLDLGPARRLGRLSELDAGRAVGRQLLVAAHCYHLVGPPPVLRPNREVADAQWLPLSTLLDNRRWIAYHHPASGARFPAIQLDHEHQVIWGLTLRFLGDLFGRLGRQFPV